MSHWTYIDEKVPQTSGDYLVVVKLGGKVGNYVFMRKTTTNSAMTC